MFAVLWLRDGEDAAGRLGVVASKKVGNSVARSRAKRRLREWYRLNQFDLPETKDVILVARRAVLYAPQNELNEDLAKLFSQVAQLQTPCEYPKCVPADPLPAKEPNE